MADLPYRIDLKVRNNRLLKALVRAFPYIKPSTPAWAEALDIPLGTLYELIALKKSAVVLGGYRVGEWTPSALKIADAVGELPEYLFDPALYGETPKKLSIEADERLLKGAGGGGRLMLESPAASLEKKAICESLEAALKTLSPREEKVLKLRFGIDDQSPHTLQEIANFLGVSRGVVAKIERKALNKLRQKPRVEIIEAGGYEPPQKAPIKRGRRIWDDFNKI